MEKIFEYSLKYHHGLYCMDNETSAIPKWGAQWAAFIREKAAQAGTAVETAEMWDPWNLAHPMRDAAFDHPEVHSFIDVSQNNHQKG